MDPTTAQIITAGIGVAGTLAAAVTAGYVAHRATLRAELARHAHEDATRWHASIFESATTFVAELAVIEMRMGSVRSDLAKLGEESNEKLQAKVSLQLEESGEQIRGLTVLAATIANLAPQSMIDAMEETLGALMELNRCQLPSSRTDDQYKAASEELGRKRSRFSAATRVQLGVTPPPTEESPTGRRLRSLAARIDRRRAKRRDAATAAEDGPSQATPPQA